MPPAAAPRPARSDTRERIVEATLERYADIGIENIGMADVAQAAGLTRAALYYHFAGKKELVHAVLIRRGEQIHDQIREELAFRPATVDLIVTANVRVVEIGLADPISRSLAAPGNEHLTADVVLSEQMRPLHDRFWVPMLQAATDAGELRTDQSFQDIISWMVFLQLALVSLGPDFGFVEHEQLRARLDAFLRPALGAV